MFQRIKTGVLSGNQLKLIALISMTVDHVGAYLLPQLRILRIIGRLAFPIFAYMLAEGCRYTRNKYKYLLVLGGTALIVQITGFVAMGNLKQSVLVTFFMSAVWCFAVEVLLKKKNLLSLSAVIGCGVAVYFITELLPGFLSDYRFSVDYRFWGVLFPVAVFAVSGKMDKLIVASAMCLVLSLYYGGVQWYSLLTIPFLALYNGQRGFKGMKYFYYVYFPVHLIVIWCIGLVVG